MSLFRAAAMRAADRLAVESGVPGLRLMENAGRAVAEVAERLTQPGLPGPRSGGWITVLAGKGNNGGDGLVAARYLARRGFEVEVVLAEGGDAFTGDALVNLGVLVQEGLVQPRSFEGPSPELARRLAGSTVIIDALLGTGSQGAPRGPVATLIDLLNQAAGERSGPAGAAGALRPLILSVDLPSALDPDTGEANRPCVRADATVTLGGVKIGLILPQAAEFVGRLYLAPIGLPPECLGGPSAHWLLPEEAGALVPRRPRLGHKGTFGHVWIVAGSPGYTGAGVLAGLGALRGGAGLATVACPENCRQTVAAALPELLTKGLCFGPDGRLDAEAAVDVVAGLSRAATGAALVIGPGLGATSEIADLTRALLRDPGRRSPVVLDADALNAIALAGPAAVTELLSSVAPPSDVLASAIDASAIAASAPSSRGPRPRRPGIILTPHPGEMARLTGRSTDSIQADRLESARRAARDWGVIVVLKGAGTVIASPDGSVWINATGSPAMATAGSGDVLAGAIGAGLAQGQSPLGAALAAVSAHGLAGDLAARDIGSRGLLASDIAHRLPRALDLMSGPPVPGLAGLEDPVVAGYGPVVIEPPAPDGDSG